ncbi:MAG TPA: tetratricopeptide repeat protein [Rhodocyclaceae bacterium]|nr:tetratricopeptide repeat protein [Rhodocyclaceae bacterium]
MVRKLIAASVALIFAGLTHAASGPATKGQVPSVSASASRNDLTARTVFQVLLGELALQRGEIDLGVSSYADLARRTRDPRVLERATEVAGYARQFELAYDLAKTWVEIEPDSTKARQSLTTLLILLNRMDELAPQLSTLLEQDKANLGDNLLRLNRMLIRHSDRQSVLQLVEKVTAPYGNVPEAHFALATAAANAGESARASTEVEKALKLRPDWEMAALLRAQLQLRESPTQAIDTLNRFVDKHPGAKDARMALARMFISEKRYDESRRQFDRLLADAPDNPEVIYPVAMLALQQNDLKTGKSQLERLLQTDFPDKGTVHFFLGQIEEEQKHPDAALAHYKEVSAGDQFIPARARAAQILAQQGKFDDARRFIQATPGRTDQEQAQLMQAESQLLREAKRYEESYVVLEKALARFPDNTDLLYDAALMAERLGRMDVLESHLQRLIQIKPDHAHGLNALGYSWADRNVHLNEAHDLIARAITLAPEDPFIMDSLGWVLFRQGKLEESLKTLEQAYKRKPDPEIAAHLSEVLWSMDRKDDARRLLREAAKKNPDNDVLSAAIKKYLP